LQKSGAGQVEDRSPSDAIRVGSRRAHRLNNSFKQLFYFVKGKLPKHLLQEYAALPLKS
jgi:hypothetical protein